MGGCGSKPEKSNKDNLYKEDQTAGPTGNLTGGPANGAIVKESTFNPNAFDHVIANKGSVEQEYDLITPPLGQGAFGEVRKAIHKSSGLERAVKIIYKDKSDPVELAKIKDEVNILGQLDHPHILNVFEYFEDENHLYIVTELCTGGELFDKIIEKKRFTESEACHLMEQMLSAVVFCHRQGIVHRDLKPENTLYATKKLDSIIRVIDFGTSIKVNKDNLHEKIGTPYYIAPEVLKGTYDAKCDVWSLGVILYILLTGTPPFNGKDDRAIIERVKAGRYSLNKPAFKYVSETGKDLLQKMLLYDPVKRPSAEQCYNHKWFKKDHRIDKKKLDTETLANFKNFHYKTKLQRALYYFLANNLASEEEKKNLTKTFKALDTNGDGVLSKEEIKKGYKKTMGITNKELDALLKQVDSNENSDINYTEFMVASLDRRRLLTDARMEACFKLFDKDNSGQITIKEFQELLGGNNISDKKWEATLKEADSNGDGNIDLKEFKEIFKKMMDESGLK